MFPLQETITLLSKKEDKLLYFDDKYSPPKEKIGNLCLQILHIFEQPEFSIYGKQKRDELNKKNTAFYRIFSHAIKVKHGKVNSSYYSDSILKLPMIAYYIEKDQMYNYGYTPVIEIDGSEYCFFKDYFFVVDELIKILELNLNIQINYDIKVPIYNIQSDGLLIQLCDTYNFLKGMTENTNLRVLKKINDNWVPSNYHDIRFKIF